METEHVIKIEKIIVNGKEVYVSQTPSAEQSAVILLLLALIFIAGISVFLYYKGKAARKTGGRKRVVKKRKVRKKRKV